MLLKMGKEFASFDRYTGIINNVNTLSSIVGYLCALLLAVTYKQAPQRFWNSLPTPRTRKILHRRRLKIVGRGYFFFPPKW